ncbi:hypothetical protein KKE14_00085 [Patescibacteria group bacterium]|nr:hypothetical protein [Patescibacteria group bacterium]
MKNIVIGIVVVGLIAVGLALSPTPIRNSKNHTAVASVTLYKSPTCSCCVQYTKYLREHNYDVDVVLTDDMEALRARYNISDDMSSCHTMIVGDYFVEGHIPLEAVDKLIAEAPDVDGISLPAMPAGSPGMPGTKSEPFVIYELTKGIAKEFMSI